MSEAPDLIVTGARLQGTNVDAVALRNGRVVEVGDRRRVLRLRGPSSRVVDAGAGTLLCRGFHDAHVHLHAMAAAESEYALRGEGINAIVEVARRERDVTAHGNWIVIADVDADLVAALQLRPRLDDACPETPVLVRARDHHTCLVNAAGLRALGLSERPSGVLREADAFRAAESSRHRSLDARLDALERVLGGLARRGFVAVHEMSGSTDLPLLVALNEAGRLPLDVFATLSPAAAAPEIRRDPAAGGRLHIAGVKAFLDGALGSRTAALLAPYDDAPGHTGTLALDAAEARETVGAAAARGLPSFLHAIGDAAVRQALDALASVRATDSRPLRHRIEHAQTVHPDDVPRFAAQGVVASVQPTHLVGDAEAVRRSLGPRSSRAFPLRTLAESEAVLAFGSDAPIESADPLEAIRAAVHRRGRDGSCLHAEESVTVAQALGALTSGARYAVSDDAGTGRIRAGDRGCFTLLSHDIERRPDTLGDARVVVTVIDGAMTDAAAAAESR